MCCTCAYSQTTEQASTLPKARAARPNIVLILTDDMAYGDLAMMTNVKKFLTDEGASFPNYFVTNSLCCPSRTSILRGQFVHNHKVIFNDKGYRLFYDFGHERSTIATWLKQAGYRTALMGKYLNGYAFKQQESYVPPGWDEWNSPIDRKAYRGFNYRLNENGKIVSYGNSESDYLTDVLSRKAIEFIKSSKADQPFFLYLSVYAPHLPATPAPRHADLYPGVEAPKTASFDAPDVSTKPRFVRWSSRLNEKTLNQINRLYRRRLQSLRAVDEMVFALVQTLEKSKQLANTYIVFTSDNGFHLGQHRLAWGKQTAYDEDIRVPLIIRGPGITAGQRIDELGLETDLAPTFADWAGITPPSFVDGRSLVPLLRRQAVPWRNGVLIEQQPGPEPFMSRIEKIIFKGKFPLPDYAGVRSKDYLYVEYSNGERELYDLKQDPEQLSNLYINADPELMRRLSSWLGKMKACSAALCRESEQNVPGLRP